ncbi:RNA polymerase sigma factor [Pseudoalteromonas sp. ACER1]|uniref:RNA polymerase sigma factor n=1 Tax=unclassified Pseudoalteromonas TaxID=194690 RepID=UPI001F206118|nr:MULTISPECIES: RNA polymerase sigma factor [unclassified Pseudoalteromonas]MCF2848990.1 RNA polymerase sigma factor [Pseudoalteromonas sp. PAST1]MCO7212447.1 RNA polymerase sigma factor [Pseudoalteromonas sp. ACER1]
MLMSIKTWLFDKPNTDCLAQYAKTGDNRYLNQLVAQYGNDLYHYLVTQSDKDLALDICQQTWLKVIDKRDFYNDQNNPKAWLFRLARNLLIDEFRKQQKFVELEDNQLFAESQDASYHYDYEAFDKALMALSFVQREALTLQQEGFSLEDIVAITQSNPETIKTRLRYARQNLKQQLGGLHEA